MCWFWKTCSFTNWTSTYIRQDVHVYLETVYSPTLSRLSILSKNMFAFSLEITFNNPNILLWFDPFDCFFFFFFFFLFIWFSKKWKTSSQKPRQHFNQGTHNVPRTPLRCLTTPYLCWFVSNRAYNQLNQLIPLLGLFSWTARKKNIKEERSKKKY